MPARDTDTTDSNAIDMLTGAADQATVMNWHAGPVVAPYVTLDTATTSIDATFALTGVKVKGRQVLTLTVANHGSTPITADVSTPYGRITVGAVSAGGTGSGSLRTAGPQTRAFTASVEAVAPDGTRKTFPVAYPGSKAR